VLTAAGEATLGPKLNASGKGRLEADLAAVMKQPVLAAAASLSRGDLILDFDVASGDPLHGSAKIALRNLVARQGSRALGDVDCQVDAGLKPDFSSGQVKIPLSLTVGGRCSDITLDGGFSRAASALTFTGKLSSSQIVVDDFMALAALAPQGSAPGSAATAKPAGGNGPQSRPAKVAPSTPVQAAVPPASVPSTSAATPARDADPFWKGIGGHFEADLKLVKYGRDYTISDMVCAAALDESRLSLDNLEGKFKGNAFKVSAGITFAPKEAQPYTLTGAVKIPGFDVGDFLRAANPSQPPAIETQLTIDAKFNGSGATAPDLAQNVYGQCDITGSKGILRALGNKGKTAGAASGILGFAGALTNSDFTMAMGQLTGILKEMPFDQFIMHVNRGTDMNLNLTSLEFISPAIRLTGNGTIQYKKGVSIADQPLHVEMQLAGRDYMSVVLGRLYLLGEQQDDKGYSMMSSPFLIVGTPANPDSSQLWKIVGAASVKAAAGLLFR